MTTEELLVEAVRRLDSPVYDELRASLDAFPAPRVEVDCDLLRTLIDELVALRLGMKMLLSLDATNPDVVRVHKRCFDEMKRELEDARKTVEGARALLRKLTELHETLIGALARCP